MDIIKNQFAKILTPISDGGIDELKHIEHCARTAYLSYQYSGDIEKTKRFISGIIKRGHESCLEHGYLSVKFLTDRGVANEIVRHRICSYTQESTRYCNYSKGNGEIRCLMPIGFDLPENRNKFDFWFRSCHVAEQYYMDLIKEGATPEEARSVLPLSLVTQIVVTTNYREWRHIFKLRTADDAHPQIRQLMGPLLAELKTRIPVLFDDIPSEEWDGKGTTILEGIDCEEN